MLRFIAIAPSLKSVCLGDIHLQYLYLNTKLITQPNLRVLAEFENEGYQQFDMVEYLLKIKLNSKKLK